jgi:hypothetical protein
MVTIILAIALLVAIAGLAVEVGIASWNIHRADGYQHREAVARNTAELSACQRHNLANRLKLLDNYASKVSWLLNFLYNRYDKFSDLEKEVDAGLKDVAEDTPAGEADARYSDLKKALKIVRVTVRASSRMGSMMESIASQLEQIVEDLRDDFEDTEARQ